MKVKFSGQKLSKAKGYSNLYIDSAIPKELLRTKEYQLRIKKSLKNLNFKKKDSDSCYVVIVFNYGPDIFVIRKMSYYRKIAKAFNASDIEFVHHYLIHHTGTGKMMFHSSSFEDVKKIYK